MATLFGTTAEGESLPVQVNEFGQLVAQGLPGLQGPPGPEGPMGPVGNVPFTSGAFEPSYISSDETDTGFFDYTHRSGYWYRFGPLLTVNISLQTDSSAVTGIRGYIELGGLPEEAAFATPSSSSVYGPYSVWWLRLASGLNVPRPVISYVSSRRSFRVYKDTTTSLTSISFGELQAEGNAYNGIRCSFSGLARDAVRSVPIALDELM